VKPATSLADHARRYLSLHLLYNTGVLSVLKSDVSGTFPVGKCWEAGSSEKVMCVLMDYANKDHLVMFCNRHGDILRKPFSVKNTPEGIG